MAVGRRCGGRLCAWAGFGARTQLREHTFLVLLLALLLNLVLLDVVALGHFLAAVRLGVLIGQHLPGQYRQLLQVHFMVSLQCVCTNTTCTKLTKRAYEYGVLMSRK